MQWAGTGMDQERLDFEPTQPDPRGKHMEMTQRHTRGHAPVARRALPARQRRIAVTVLALAAAMALGVWVTAALAAGAPDAHAHHHHHVMPETTRSLADYTIPDVKLVRDDGKTVALNQELDDGRPLVMNFIYTTCTSVCPLTSQTFSELQTKLGTRRDAVHMVSISIDPEQDTPARLKEYAKKFSAGPQWQHYTGTLAASTTAQRAFGAYSGNKMNHAPITLVRAAPGARWVRIDGFATADQLVAELRGTAATK
jgi:protein SCO1